LDFLAVAVEMAEDITGGASVKVDVYQTLEKTKQCEEKSIIRSA